MRNLQSLLFNNVAGRVVYGDVRLYPRKKESIIKPIIINTYKFAVYCNYNLFRNGLCLCCERESSLGTIDFFSYCSSREFASEIVNYYNNTYRCSLDYVLEMVPHGDCVEFEVRITKDDFENEVLKESIIEAFVDKLLEGREAEFARSEYQDWLENEYCYV